MDLTKKFAKSFASLAKRKKYTVMLEGLTKLNEGKTIF